MKRCLKIVFDITGAPKNFLTFVQGCAKKFTIEGFAQIQESKLLHIIICGKNEQIENFLDCIHGGHQGWYPINIKEEPFLSSRDYRGTFRVIE